MVVMIVVAQLYGVLQLALLGWTARSVRWRVLVVAFAVGLYAAAPLTIALEWLLWHAWAAASGRALNSAIGVGAYTVDPFIEEIVKLAPVALLWWVLRPVRSWGRTDILLVAAAVGSGFGLAEHLLRYADRADRAIAAADGGWVLPVSMFAGIRIPGPGGLLTSWLPSGAGADAYLAGNAADLINVHLAWSAIGGLGLALLLRPPLERTHAWRIFGALLIFWAGADHALNNAQGGGRTAKSLAEPFAALREGIGVYVVVALAVAVVLDRMTLSRRLAARPELRLSDETPGPVGVSALLGHATARLPWSVAAVCGFIRVRRSVLLTTRDDESSAAQAVRRLHDALDTAGDREWAAVDTGMRARLRGLRHPLVGLSASSIMILTLWFALLALPALYMVVGGQPAFSAVQGWFGTAALFSLTVAIAVLAGGVTGWGLLTGLRSLPGLLRGGVVDPVATTGLLVLARGGALLLTVFSLVGVARGRRVDDPLVSSSHVLEAIGDSLLLVGLLLAAAAILLTFPPSGLLVPVLAGAEVAGGAAATEAAAVLLGKLAVGSLAGWLLTEAADSGSGSGSGAGPRDNVGRFPEEDFEGTGYSADEIGALTHRHTGGGDLHIGGGGLDRPTEAQIMNVLRQGESSELTGQNAVQYVKDGIRVIINRDMPWRSTAYRIGS